MFDRREAKRLPDVVIRVWKAFDTNPANPIFPVIDELKKANFNVTLTHLSTDRGATNVVRTDGPGESVLNDLWGTSEMKSIMRAYGGTLYTHGGITEEPLASTRWSEDRKKQVYAWSVSVREEIMKRQARERGRNVNFEDEAMRVLRAIIRETLEGGLEPLDAEQLKDLARQTARLQLELDGNS